MDVSHQVLPGQQTLHVHKHRLPHCLQPLEISVQSEEEKTKICTFQTNCLNVDLTDLRRPGETLSSPSNAVHSVLIGGRNQEADGWYSRLAAFIIQYPPLVRLRVVQQSTFIPSVNCDLKGGEKYMLMSDWSMD